MSDLPNPTPGDAPKGKPQEHERLVTEFLHSAVYAALQEPVKGVSQLVDHVAGTNLEQKVTIMSKPEGGSGTGDWMAQQLGGAAGMLVPFLLVKSGVGAVMGESIKGTEGIASLGMSLKEAGLTGFAYDSLLKPTDANATNNFWVARGLSGVAGAATFMTLTGSAYGLGKLGNVTASRGIIGASTLTPLLRNPISAGILSGVPAGFVSAEGSSLANNNKLASAQEIGQSMAGMAFVGGVFGANEVVKSKYTDGKSIPKFVAGRLIDAWTAKPSNGGAFGVAEGFHSDLNFRADSEHSPDSSTQSGSVPVAKTLTKTESAFIVKDAIRPRSATVKTNNADISAPIDSLPLDKNSMAKANRRGKQAEPANAGADASGNTIAPASPLPDMPIFANEKIREILLKQTPATQTIPWYMAENITGKTVIPEATGASTRADGMTVTPWRHGEIWRTSTGKTFVFNEEAGKALGYDQYGRLTQSIVTDAHRREAKEHTYVYGEDDQLVAAVAHGSVWIRGEDGWSRASLRSRDLRLVKQPETVVAVNANGDLLVGNASSATVKSAEGRVSHLDTDGDQVLARASSAYEQNQASRLAKIYGADSAGNNLLDLVESFKSLTTERSVDREQSTTLLGEFNRLLEGGATDQAADLLKSTNQLLQSDETNVVTSLNLTRLKSGETIAVVHSEDPDSGFALMRSTYGESQTDQNGVISTEFADGWRTVKEPHPDFESDDEHYRKYYSPQDRLAKIEYQAGLGSSVRQFSEDAAGNVTSMKETNSAGITTTLTKQQQGDWLLQMKQTHGSLTKHRFESASFEDIVTGKRSATDGTQVKFYLDGDREWFTPDHRVRSERANGRVDFVSADLGFERDLLERTLDKIYAKETPVERTRELQERRKQRFLDLVDQFEINAKKRALPEQTIALTMAQINRILNEPSPVWTSRQRIDLAELVLSHAVNPIEISQGNNQTCTLAALEHRLYALAPDKVAQVIADVSRSGSYILANGVKIDGREIPRGLAPDPEALKNLNLQRLGLDSKAIDGTRDFASQIAQSVFANARWSEMSVYVADDTVVNDKIAYIHKTDGMRRMIFMEPRNLASVNDRDATLIKVYNENGELVGKIDPSRAEPVLDDHQLWLQELPPGETGYDGNGQPLVSRTKPGDISFAPAQPTDESSDLSSVSLNWNGTVIPLRDANSRLLNGPEMGAFDASTIYDKVTGQASPIPFVFDDEFLKSPDHLAQRLLQLQEAHQLPGLMTVNVGNPLFGHADSDWHTINVYNYDPESALVRYSNQWSAVDDRMANGVPLSDLFQAMQPVVADQSIVGDASGAPAIRPLPKPYWLRAALRQQRLEAQAESWR